MAQGKEEVQQKMKVEEEELHINFWPSHPRVERRNRKLPKIAGTCTWPGREWWGGGAASYSYDDYIYNKWPHDDYIVHNWLHDVQIREGTQAAEGVSAADMTRRKQVTITVIVIVKFPELKIITRSLIFSPLQVERQKKHLLKNLNMFISPVRLCVRYLCSICNWTFFFTFQYFLMTTFQIITGTYPLTLMIPN